MILLRITSSYFCAGVVIEDGFCVEAAPILRKACLHKSALTIYRRAHLAGWTIEML